MTVGSIPQLLSAAPRIKNQPLFVLSLEAGESFVREVDLPYTSYTPFECGVQTVSLSEEGKHSEGKSPAPWAALGRVVQACRTVAGGQAGLNS